MDDEDPYTAIGAVVCCPGADDAIAPVRPMVGVLGPLTLTRGQVALPLRTAGQRGLLSLLALSAGRPVERDEIIWALWGERPPKTCVTQVHAAVAQLREVLQPPARSEGGRSARSPDSPLQLIPGGYLLSLAHADTDLTRFDALLDSARHLRTHGTLPEEAEALAQAVAHWRGPVLSGSNPRLVEHPLALTANRARLAATLAYASVALDLGWYEQVVGPLWALVRDEPYHEGLHSALMRTLAGLGERAAALRLYVTLRERLVEELGVEPGDEMRAAHLAILRGDGTSPTESVTVTDPRVRPDVVPCLLPPDIADFTGRTQEVEWLRSVLTGGIGAVAVAAVAGMGGIGKSALAMHVAHQLSGSFPDGQLHANMRGVAAKPADPTDVLGRFLRALGVDSRDVPEPVDERVELYRTLLAGRRVLVVLDDAGTEAHVRPLLPGSASCAVLVTSRVRLSGVESARWIDLDVFAADEAIDLLASVADERVTADAVGATEVVRLCGGLPLALRIAGARLAARPQWRLADLSRMLADERRRLDVLVTGDLEVRASLALSYTGLPEARRRLLRRLSLIDVPDFASWLADAVVDASAGDAADLEQLVDAQLLSVAGMDAAGQHRYRFHDLVRLYARERAVLEDTAEARTAAVVRGLGGWLARAEILAEQIPGPSYAAIHGDADRPALEPGQLDGLDAATWFDAEHAALTAATRQACAAGLIDLAFDLAGCMEKHFDLRGMYREWRNLNEHVMQACTAAGNLRGEAVMLRGLIDVFIWNTTESDGQAIAKLHADRARLLAIFTELGDQRGMADAEVILAWGLIAEGRNDDARRTARRSLRLATTTGHLGGQARAHVALAISFSELRPVAAIAHLRSALDLTRCLNNPRYEAGVLQLLAVAYQTTGEMQRSREVLAQALDIVRRYHDHYSEAQNMLVLSRLYLKLGDPAAADAAEAALTIARTYHITHQTADAFSILGEIAIADGRHTDAVAPLAESVRLWRTRGWPNFLADALTNLGHAHRPHDPHSAHTAWTEALDLYRTTGNERKSRTLAALLADW